MTKMHDNPLKISLDKYPDSRGYFYELFRKCNYDFDFVQDNLSHSHKGVLRGLHHQTSNPQGKLVTVITGKVQDVIIDVRKNSENFGLVKSFVLNEGESLWIPPNFLHGFLALEDTNFLYKCTQYYDPNSEITVNSLDRNLSINWQMEPKNMIRSKKDIEGISYCSFIKMFI